MRTPLLIILAASAAAPLAAAPARDVAIVSAGSEQAVKLNKVTLSRPFGAQLVDRLAVAGGYAIGGRRLYLIRGEARGDCPARYVVIEAGRRSAPALTAPFGTCSAKAVGRVARGTLMVTMPATAAGGPPVRFPLENGAMRLLDARPAAAMADAPGAPPGYAARAPATCRSADSLSAAARADMIAEFESGYPEEFRRKGAANKTDIAADELRPLLSAMACLSLWPEGARVLDRSRPLFASRHGTAAFATLDAIAHDPLTEAAMLAAVRSFSAEMTYRVGTSALRWRAG